MIVLGLIVFVKCITISNAVISQDITFRQFFVEFGSKPEFQNTRVEFPLPYVSYYEDLDSAVSRIARHEWTFIDFGRDSSAHRKPVDAYTARVIAIDETSVNYLREGVDNGILIIYEFKKIRSKWFLTKIVDKST